MFASTKQKLGHILLSTMISKTSRWWWTTQVTSLLWSPVSPFIHKSRFILLASDQNLEDPPEFRKMLTGICEINSELCIQPSLHRITILSLCSKTRWTFKVRACLSTFLSHLQALCYILWGGVFYDTDKICFSIAI